MTFHDTSIADASRHYRERHPERKLASTRVWRRRNKSYFTAYNRRYRIEHPEVRMIEASRQRAKKYGLQHTIRPKDLLPLPEKCPVLGFVLNYENTKTADNSPSLDRIDNDLGYVLGNVIVVSWKANRLKSNATVNELEAIAKFYGELQS